MRFVIALFVAALCATVLAGDGPPPLPSARFQRCRVEVYCYGRAGGVDVPFPTIPLSHTSSAYTLLTCKSMSDEESFCRFDLYAKSDQTVTQSAENDYGDTIISVTADGTTSACTVTGNDGLDGQAAINVGEIARVDTNNNEMTCHVLAMSSVTAGTN